MAMPYTFFLDDLKWKIKYEEDQNKKLKAEQNKNKDASYKRLKSRNK